MQLEELKQQIIDRFNLAEYTNQFTDDVNGCYDVWDILNTLINYGYDKQGALDIMFQILID